MRSLSGKAAGVNGRQAAVLPGGNVPVRPDQPDAEIPRNVRIPPSPGQLQSSLHVFG